MFLHNAPAILDVDAANSQPSLSLRTQCEAALQKMQAIEKGGVSTEVRRR